VTTTVLESLSLRDRATTTEITTIGHLSFGTVPGIKVQSSNSSYNEILNIFFSTTKDVKKLNIGYSLHT